MKTPLSIRNFSFGLIIAIIVIGSSSTLAQNPPFQMNPMVGNAIGGPGPVIGISPAPSNSPMPESQPAPPPAPGNISNLNSGNMNVIACGYDAQGVWRVFPLYVQYDFNGVNYNVTVLNAWDPWTNMWNNDVDVQAFNTDYTLRGINYNFYVVLSYGTFYFNL